MYVVLSGSVVLCNVWPILTAVLFGEGEPIIVMQPLKRKEKRCEKEAWKKVMIREAVWNLSVYTFVDDSGRLAVA